MPKIRSHSDANRPQELTISSSQDGSYIYISVSNDGKRVARTRARTDKLLAAIGKALVETPAQAVAASKRQLP